MRTKPFGDGAPFNDASARILSIRDFKASLVPS
jgi:hypothetical protein